MSIRRRDVRRGGSHRSRRVHAPLRARREGIRRIRRLSDRNSRGRPSHPGISAQTLLEGGSSGEQQATASVPRQQTLSSDVPDAFRMAGLYPAARGQGKVGSRSARQQYAHAVAETSYAPCGDLSLAYQVFGDGPVELVFVPPFTSHVELFWTLPGFKANLDQLATFCRVLLFDKGGVGLSDPVPHVPTLDDRAAEIEAVMDAVGFRS